MHRLCPFATGRRSRTLWGAALAATALGVIPASTPSTAEAQELRFTLVPTAERVFWNDDLGLDDTYLYGGRLGLVFGRYISLQGYYLTSDGTETLFEDTGLEDPGGAPFANQGLDVRNYGADILVNLGTSALHPFIKAGGSILNFQPETGNDTKQIALKFGGGLRFGEPGKLRLSVFAEDMLFRVNRFNFAPITPGDPVPEDPDADEVYHNLVVGAGLVIPFGGEQFFDDRPQVPAGRVAFPLELYAGRVDFDDDLTIDEQNFVGARAGVNFGRLIGVRGYYWRGAAEGFDEFQDIQSYGGELQFNLNDGVGVTPYLLAGAGQLDFESDFRDLRGNQRDDRTMLILGGGLGFGLTENLRLNVAARNYLFSDRDLNDVASTDELRSNWALSAGIGFWVGGDLPDETRDRPAPMRRARADREYTRDLSTARMERNRMAVKERAQAAREQRLRDAERQLGLTPRERQVLQARRQLAEERLNTIAELHNYAGDQVVTLPVPQQGELYVRYGPNNDTTIIRGGQAAAGYQQQQRTPMMPMSPAYGNEPLSRAELREAVREVLRDELRTELERDRYIRELNTPRDTRDVIVMPPTQVQPTPMQPSPLMSRDAIRRRAEDIRRMRLMDAQRRLQMQQMQQRQQPAYRDTVAMRPVVPRRSMPLTGKVVPTQQMTTAEYEAHVMDRVDQLMAARMAAERDSIRAILRAELAQRTDAANDQRLLDAIDRIIVVRVREEAERQRALGMQQELQMQRQGQAAQRDTLLGGRGHAQYAMWQPRAVSAYAGAGLGDFSQFVVGGKVNLGPISEDMTNMFFVPEVALGFGSGATTFLAAGNLRYQFPRYRFLNTGIFSPFLSLGLGIMNWSDEGLGDKEGTDVVVNPSFGTFFEVSALETVLGTPVLFAEYQGVSFFDVNRLLFGLNWQL